MKKYKLLVLSLLLVCVTASAQKPFCPFLECLSVNTSLSNSCEEVKTYARITNPSSYVYSTTVSWDFGDGSPAVSNVENFTGNDIFYRESSHTYTLPGTYIATLTLTGGYLSYTCTSTATVEVNAAGVCETCTTYSVLSTGYDPATALPIPTATMVAGTPDPGWIVRRRFDLSAPSNTPVPATIASFNTPAYVIYPKDQYCVFAPLGSSRNISVNSFHNSVYATPNIHTYRRGFILPSTFPPSTMYTLVMKLRADDYVFDAQLNGGSILASGIPNPDGSLQISINSCSGFLLTDSNYIDITVADINGGSTQLDAEIMLYECPLVMPCASNGGGTINWSWNTSWGYGWFYYWSYWYCATFGSSTGFCPPTGSPGIPGSGGGGGSCQGCPGGGWYWVYVSGWGWMWLSGGSSGSGSITCPNCVPSFAPIPGNKYLVSAWVKEKDAIQSKTSYTYPGISILYPSTGGSDGPFLPSGNIIDGWQRIESEFTIPAGATNMTIKLECTSDDCYYDDIRVLPFDGSLKSYVYDPVNLRLVAELDERNYATLYEYDEEGRLIRLKKETEKGIMTIKENRNSSKK